MYIQLPEPKCSKCGYTSSETFKRREVSGRRCLICGHEQRQATTTYPSAPRDNNIMWQSGPPSENTF